MGVPKRIEEGRESASSSMARYTRADVEMAPPSSRIPSCAGEQASPTFEREQKAETTSRSTAARLNATTHNNKQVS
jgi:hypothetical protein